MTDRAATAGRIHPPRIAEVFYVITIEVFFDDKA
jgi:hypothetical protein